MKKYFYTLFITLIAVTTTMTIVSCSGDDDVDDSSKILSCPDNHHPHMIDLGLPSGTLWACCNVGADKPEDYGRYFAWGETEEKSEYNQVTYLYCTGVDEDDDGWYDDYHSPSGGYGIWQNLGSDIAGSEYDVAHVKWGGSWKMPSESQILELMRYCTCTWTPSNGINGLLLKGPSGSTIFMPAAGYRRYQWGDFQGNEANIVGLEGYYWSSTPFPLGFDYDAYSLWLHSDGIGLHSSSVGRSEGRSVRPVVNAE